MTTTDRSTRIRLYGWDDWEGSARSVRALLFGQMVQRATPVVKEYLSDLYHDAHWITEHVNGPTEFEWLTRASGTNIGLPDDPSNSARIGVQIGAGEDAVFYQVTITEERGEWSATFTQVPLDEVPPVQAEETCRGCGETRRSVPSPTCQGGLGHDFVSEQEQT